MIYKGPTLSSPVYTQTRAGDCADYAVLSAVRQVGVDVDEKYLIQKEDLTIQDVVKNLVKDKKIRGIQLLTTPGAIDLWLKRGHFIISGAGTISFDSVRNAPFIQSFQGTTPHNFCIVADLGDRWTAKDSQGPMFADRGYWYIMKSEFRRIKKFRVII